MTLANGEERYRRRRCGRVKVVSGKPIRK